MFTHTINLQLGGQAYMSSDVNGMIEASTNKFEYVDPLKRQICSMEAFFALMSV